MIQSIAVNILESIIGFASGLAVGCGFVAFITLLGVIPRLIQLTGTKKFVKPLIASVIMGVLLGTYLSFTDLTWNEPVILLLVWGLLHGIFNGMLAAALTEVLNVFPIIAKRLHIDEHLLWLLMAIVFGKIAGSLYQWLVFVK